MDGRAEAARDTVAAGLHELVDAARPLAGVVAVGRPASIRSPADALWPEPHSVRFDFEATRADAEWIDAAAKEARERLDRVDLPEAIGHFDWRAGNLGFDGTELVAIYDWDAIARAPEAVVVGNTAAQFCIDWSGPELDPVPTVDEMIAFVSDYEAARGATFSATEVEAVDAANLAMITYGARCQHSDLTLRPELAGPADSRWCRLLGERGDRVW